jgi:hypothetical protein
MFSKWQFRTELSRVFSSMIAVSVCTRASMWPSVEFRIAKRDAVEVHVLHMGPGIDVALSVDDPVQNGGDDVEGVGINARRAAGSSRRRVA